jgi:hypothetical protein
MFDTTKTEEQTKFNEIRKEKGLRAALDWRDCLVQRRGLAVSFQYSESRLNQLVRLVGWDKTTSHSASIIFFPLQKRRAYSSLPPPTTPCS